MLTLQDRILAKIGDTVIIFCLFTDCKENSTLNT